MFTLLLVIFLLTESLWVVALVALAIGLLVGIPVSIVKKAATKKSVIVTVEENK